MPFLVLVAATLVGLQPLISAAVLRRRAERRGAVVDRPGDDGPAAHRAVRRWSGCTAATSAPRRACCCVAFLALGLDVGLQTVNGLKNVAVLSANVAATVVFVFFAPLDWARRRPDRGRLAGRRLARRPPRPPAAADGVPDADRGVRLRRRAPAAADLSVPACAGSARCLGFGRPLCSGAGGRLLLTHEVLGPDQEQAAACRRPSAMTAAIVVMWFSASTKLVVAAVPIVSRTEAGAWRERPRRSGRS